MTKIHLNEKLNTSGNNIWVEKNSGIAVVFYLPTSSSSDNQFD